MGLTAGAGANIPLPGNVSKSTASSTTNNQNLAVAQQQLLKQQQDIKAIQEQGAAKVAEAQSKQAQMTKIAEQYKMATLPQHAAKGQFKPLQRAAVGEYNKQLQVAENLERQLYSLDIAQGKKVSEYNINVASFNKDAQAAISALPRIPYAADISKAQSLYNQGIISASDFANYKLKAQQNEQIVQQKEQAIQQVKALTTITPPAPATVAPIAAPTIDTGKHYTLVVGNMQARSDPNAARTGNWRQDYTWVQAAWKVEGSSDADRDSRFVTVPGLPDARTFAPQVGNREVTLSTDKQAQQIQLVKIMADQSKINANDAYLAQLEAQAKAKSEAMKTGFGGAVNKEMLAPVGTVLNPKAAANAGLITSQQLKDFQQAQLKADWKGTFTDASLKLAEAPKGADVSKILQQSRLDYTPTTIFNPKPGDFGYHATQENPVGLHKYTLDDLINKRVVLTGGGLDKTALIKDKKYSLMIKSDFKLNELPKELQTSFDQSNFVLTPLAKKTQEFTKAASEKIDDIVKFNEKYNPVVKELNKTSAGQLFTSTTEQFAAGAGKGVASLPEFFTVAALGGEVVVRNIATNPEAVAKATGAGILLNIGGLEQGLSEKPAETLGMLWGAKKGGDLLDLGISKASSVKGAVATKIGTSVKSAKVADIAGRVGKSIFDTVPEQQVVEGYLAPAPKTMRSLLPSVKDFPGETGFTGELMGFEKAKVRVPDVVAPKEVTPTPELMNFGQAKIRIPDIVEPKTASPAGELMSFKDAKIRVPEVTEPIKVKKAVTGGEGRAKASVGAKPSTVPEIIDRSIYAKDWNKYQEKPSVPHDEAPASPFEITGGGATNEMMLRNLGIRANVPPKVAEPLMDITTGGRDILASGSKIKPYFELPKITDIVKTSKEEPKPPTILDLEPAKSKVTIKKDLDAELRAKWAEREKQNKAKAKSGKTTTTKEGQILIQKEKVVQEAKTIEKPQKTETVEKTKVEKPKDLLDEKAIKEAAKRSLAFSVAGIASKTKGKAVAKPTPKTVQRQRENIFSIQLPKNQAKDFQNAVSRSGLGFEPVLKPATGTKQVPKQEPDTKQKQETIPSITPILTPTTKVEPIKTTVQDILSIQIPGTKQVTKEKPDDVLKPPTKGDLLFKKEKPRTERLARGSREYGIADPAALLKQSQAFLSGSLDTAKKVAKNSPARMDILSINIGNQKTVRQNSNTKSKHGSKSDPYGLLKLDI